MNRLKSYLIAMDRSETTYINMYEGPYYDKDVHATVYDPTYYKNDICYKIERSHKLTLDKPIVTIQIPLFKIIDIKFFNIHIENCEDCTADFCLRSFNNQIQKLNEELYNYSRPDKENGVFYSFDPSGEVIKRNACYISSLNEDEDIKFYINIQIMVQLPCRDHRKAARMLCSSLPMAVEKFIFEFDPQSFENSVSLFKKQQEIRNWLLNSEYCAFIANGSILPRYKQTHKKLENAVPFKSPVSDEIEIMGIRGMGIKKGVTIITGGGYSGKSTLLDAISNGIYNHFLGDGREYVITDETAMKISAEDGRTVRNVNINAFIKWIPNGDASDFTTDHASGSTSQAANIIESIQYGTKLLIIDEDNSATNFMIQDDVMKSLIVKEPIVPFTERVEQLFLECSISTILVIGGSSEYLYVADNIILMDDYLPQNITHKIIKKKLCSHQTILWKYKRELITKNFTSFPHNSLKEKLEISEFGFIILGDEKINIRMLHNLISPAQITAIAFIIRKIQLSNRCESIDIVEAVRIILDDIKIHGLNNIYSNIFMVDSWLEIPRLNEICAVINRMKNIIFNIE